MSKSPRPSPSSYLLPAIRRHAPARSNRCYVGAQLSRRWEMDTGRRGKLLHTCFTAHHAGGAMTETTRTTECTAPGATLYLAFELGSTKWVLAFTTSPAHRPRHRQV